jgi:transposase-like protein
MSAEHRVSPANQAKVIALSCNGHNQTRIAEHLGVDEKTLRKWYGQELSFGKENVGRSAILFA